MQQPITRPRHWGAILVGWTLFAAVSAGQFSVQESVEPSLALWWELFTHILLFYLVWALLTPLALLAAGALPAKGEGGWVKGIAIVLAATPALVVAHGMIYLALHPWAFGYGSGTADLRAYLARHGLGDLCTLLALFAAHAVFRRYQGYREAELANAQLARRASELEARLSQARLEVLEMQLHPHFLFNVLNTISVLVMKGEARLANRAITRVSDYLRATLGLSGRPEIALREELDLARWYLELEEMRYGDRMRVELEIDPEALGAAVPSLVLQPLLENAVRHGIGASPHGGRIVLSAVREGERLRLEVRDDGPGPAGSHAAGAGIGLTNTRERLERLYGAVSSLDLREAEGGGAVAVVELPFRPHRGTPEARMAHAVGENAGDHRR